MAVIRDIIPAFELYQPASIDDALRLLDKFGADALVLAGGLDSMDWLKDRLKRPKAVVDLGQAGCVEDAAARAPIADHEAHVVTRLRRGAARREWRGLARERQRPEPVEAPVA